MLAISFFDDDATHEFFSSLNNNETYPKRTSTRDKVLKHFNAMRVAVLKTLKKIPSKISLTIDGWTSIANQSYYGVTILFIDEKWELQSLHPTLFLEMEDTQAKKLRILFATCRMNSR